MNLPMNPPMNPPPPEPAAAMAALMGLAAHTHTLLAMIARNGVQPAPAVCASVVQRYEQLLAEHPGLRQMAAAANAERRASRDTAAPSGAPSLAA